MARDRFRRWGARHSRVRRQLHNPYFQRSAGRRPTRWNGWRGVGIAMLFIVLAAIAIIVPIEAFTHAAFAVESITYDLPGILPERQARIRTMTEAALEEPFFFGISRRNFFLFPAGKIQASILEEGPFTEVRVKRTFPNRIVVTATQAPRVFSLTDGAHTAFTDGEGGVLDIIAGSTATSSTELFEHREAVSTTIASLIPVVLEQKTSSTVSWKSGKEALPKNCATLISFFDAGLSAVDLNGIVYQVNEDRTRVSIFTKEGITLFTDPIVNPRDQLNRLIALLKDPQYKNLDTLESIDLRYPKAYITERTP